LAVDTWVTIDAVVLLPLCLIVWLRRRLLVRAEQRRQAEQCVMDAEEVLREHRIIAEMEAEFRRP
jgi:hypothetical protein